MRQAGVIPAVAGALIAALLVAANAGAASSALTPRTLYQALLTSKFTPVPDGFYSPSVGTDDLDKRDKKHHAVGRVLVTFSGGDAGADYGIFPTLKDANERWREPPQAPPGSKIKVVGKVPGFSIPTEWINGSVTGKNAFGKKGYRPSSSRMRVRDCGAALALRPEGRG